MAQPDIVSWKENEDGSLDFKFIIVETPESYKENREAIKAFSDWYYNHPDLVDEYIEQCLVADRREGEGKP